MPSKSAMPTTNDHHQPIVIRSSTDKQAEMAGIKKLLPRIQGLLRRRTIDSRLDGLQFDHTGTTTNDITPAGGVAISVAGGLSESVQARKLERVLTGHYYIDLQGRLLRCAEPDAHSKQFTFVNPDRECPAVIIYLHVALKELTAELQPNHF